MNSNTDVKCEPEEAFMTDLDSKSSRFFQDLQQLAKRPSSESQQMHPNHHFLGQSYDLANRPLQSQQSTEALNLFSPPSPTGSINSFFNSHSFVGNPVLYNDFGFPVWENLDVLMPQHGEQAPQQQTASQQPHLRRRVSISNGHIGQIVQVNSYIYQHKHQEKEGGEGQPPVSQPEVIPQSEVVPRPEVIPQPETILQPEVSQEPLDQVQSETVKVKPKPESPELEVGEDGVPKVRLLYNNEVIFDPEQPIPGTAQWKRQKLLERNKLAAAKCRQKKKVIQKQLQQEIDNYKNETDELKRQLDRLKLAEELILKAQENYGKHGMDASVFKEILSYKRG